MILKTNLTIIYLIERSTTCFLPGLEDDIVVLSSLTSLQIKIINEVQICIH